MTARAALSGLAPRSAGVDDGAAMALADGIAASVEDRAFAEFVRLHVAGGAAAADTVAGYLREARLFRDRFLAPRGLAIAALTEDDVVAYRRDLGGRLCGDNDRHEALCPAEAARRGRPGRDPNREPGRQRRGAARSPRPRRRGCARTSTP